MDPAALAALATAGDAGQPLASQGPATQKPVPMQPPAQRHHPLPKQLTAAIKAAGSVDALEQLLEDNEALLNPIHVAAIITKLPKLEAAAGAAQFALSRSSVLTGGGDPGASLVWLSPAAPASRAVLARLLAQIKAHGAAEYGPRGLANIVWALAKLQHYPDPELREMLLDSFIMRLPSAVPQVRARAQKACRRPRHVAPRCDKGVRRGADSARPKPTTRTCRMCCGAWPS
jgi:DNA segregation ATPase FtsK/SpoIIIE-like protein